MNKLMKPKRIKYLGEFIESFFTAIPIISMFSYISTIIILWEMIKKYIVDALPWMNIGFFILFLAMIFIPIVIATFKWVIPSVWHFRSSQMGHLEEKIDKLQSELESLKKDKNA